MGTKQRTNAERRRKANAKNQRNLLNKLGKGGFKGFEKEKTLEIEPIIGAVYEIAKRNNVFTPNIRKAYEQVKLKGELLNRKESA